MGLQIKYDISDNCTSFTLVNTTGVYDVANNPTGYGSPNTETTDIDSVSITITNPSGTEFIFDASQTGTDTLPVPYPTYFPDSTSSNEYNIPSSALGLTANSYLTEGLWTVEIQEAGSVVDLVYTKRYYYLITCEAQCCVDKLLVQVKTTECADCNNRVLEKATQAFMFLQVARTAAEKNQPVLAQSMIDQVNLICAAFDCNSCG